MKAKGAQPRGVVARLRYSVGPLLPPVLRRVGGRLLNAIEARRGATYAIAGQRVKLLGGSAPTMVVSGSDERSAVDALQLERFARAIRTGDLIADVGAYRGTYTIIAAACTGPTGRVIAFEPTAANAEAIAANVRLNGFTNRVVIERSAVSDSAGTANFFAWGDATTNSLARKELGATPVQVPTVSLDGYFGDMVGPQVVKIDIEGAELLALRGAERLLASDAYIICELHPYAWMELGYTADDLRALLAKHNRYTADLATGAELTEYRYGAVLLAKHD
jgi:FkbM family methyltransferase